MDYSIKEQVNLSFPEAVAKTKTALVEEGFGILTEIDVKATLKKKLDAEWNNYVILGACNPPFAFQALKAEKEIGLMLPCNVIVYENGGKVFVSAIRPTVAMNMIDNRELAGIAEKVEKKLSKAIKNVSMENNKHPTRKIFDLVCGMELSIENVRHSFEHNGIEYYFCSETCKGHFVDNPEKYIGEN